MSGSTRIPGFLGIEIGDNATRTESEEGIFPLGIVAPPKTAQLRIVSIEFLSDHGLLRNNDVDWEDGGDLFAKPEWPVTVGNAVGHPVSQTMDTPIELEVVIDFTGPRSMRSVKGTLLGRDEKNQLQFKKDAVFKKGLNRILLISDKNLPMAVGLVSLNILWAMLGKNITNFGFFGAKGVNFIMEMTRHDVFVTMNEPIEVPMFPDITLKRMKHAIELVSGVKSVEPHTIVKRLMSKFRSGYVLGENPWNAWELVDSGKGDCRTIVAYVMNLLSMVGCPGQAKCVLVYPKIRASVPSHTYEIETKVPGVKLIDPTRKQLERDVTWSDFDVVAEETTETQKLGGLDNPGLVHPTEKWSAILFDSDGGQNAFEACLEFEHNETKYYPGGTLMEHSKLVNVITSIFKSFSWAVIDKTNEKMKTTEHIKEFS